METNKILFEQMADAIDAAELATFDLDPRTGKFTGNDRVKEWFGLDIKDEIPLETALNSIAAKDRDRVSAAIQKALDFSSGGLYEIEYTIVNSKTQQERIVRAKGKTNFNEQKVPLRFNGVIMDITVEVKVREQRQKLLKLVDNSVDLMSLLELNGANSYINAAGRDILGISQDADVSTLPINHFHTPEQIAFVEANIFPAVMTEGKWSGQFAIKNAITDEIIPLYNNCHRIDDMQTGEPIGIGAVMRDMRPELNARQILEDKVKERTKELQGVNDELEKKNVELASFAYVASHDLQEPLRKIVTFSERILAKESENFTETGKDYFQRINKAVMRMQSLIEDLLSFSRADTGGGEIERTDLGELISEVLHDLSETVKQSKASIQIGTLCEAAVIPYQFRQMLANLIGNALKFAKPGEAPQVDIRSEIISRDLLPQAETAHSDKYCHLQIADKGIGFEPQYSERIFELFQRLHGKHEFAGTGIGLAIVKKIVHNHKGLITATGIPGEGSVFDIYIPF